MTTASGTSGFNPGDSADEILSRLYRDMARIRQHMEDLASSETDEDDEDTELFGLAPTPQSTPKASLAELEMGIESAHKQYRAFIIGQLRLLDEELDTLSREQLQMLVINIAYSTFEASIFNLAANYAGKMMFCMGMNPSLFVDDFKAILRGEEL